MFSRHVPPLFFLSSPLSSFSLLQNRSLSKFPPKNPLPYGKLFIKENPLKQKPTPKYFPPVSKRSSLSKKNQQIKNTFKDNTIKIKNKTSTNNIKNNTSNTNNNTNNNNTNNTSKDSINNNLEEIPQDTISDIKPQRKTPSKTLKATPPSPALTQKNDSQHHTKNIHSRPNTPSGTKTTTPLPTNNPSSPRPIHERKGDEPVPKEEKKGESAVTEESYFKTEERKVFHLNQLKYATWFFAHKCERVHVVSSLKGDMSYKSIPQVAFIGCSNVGKSSLLNSLISSANADVARISKQPGCTQTVNYYQLYDRLMLVDLPGYGYAKISKATREGWSQFVGKYLTSNNNLNRVFILIDARHGIKDKDKELMEMLEKKKRNFQLIITKVDKLTSPQLNQVLSEIYTYILEKKFACGTKELIVTSAKQKYGVNLLQAYCLDCCGLASNWLPKFVEKQEDEKDMEELAKLGIN